MHAPAPRAADVGSRAPRRLASGLQGLLLAVVVGLALQGCVAVRFDRQAMLGQVVDSVIVPAHRALAAEVELLDQAAAAFALRPDSAGLGRLQERWVAAEEAWKAVELFQFESLVLVHNTIEKRPPRETFIEEAVGDFSFPPEGGDVEGTRREGVERVEGLGSTTRGLAAVEYLIFPDLDESDAGEGMAAVLGRMEDPSRRAFLLALTGNLVTKADELVAFWTPEGVDFGRTFRENSSDGADLQGSVSLLANRMIGLYETAMQVRLGMPMGRTTDGVPRPDEVEAPRSGVSLALLRATVESVRLTFDAGLDDYLDHLDSAPEDRRLSGRIHDQFAAVFRAMEAVDGPLRRAVSEDVRDVDALYEEMRTLLVLLKTEMAGLLGITVTFGDADGD